MWYLSSCQNRNELRCGIQIFDLHWQLTIEGYTKDACLIKICITNIIYIITNSNLIILKTQNSRVGMNEY